MADQPKPAGQDPAADPGQDPAGGGDPKTDPGQDPKQTGQDPGAGGGQDPKPELTLEAAKSELARARREAAAERKRATELEAQVKAHDDEKLSELERSQKLAADAEKKAADKERELQEARLERAAERSGVKAGILDPEDASLLMDRTLVEYDDDGKPRQESVDAAVAALKERKPHLFRTDAPGKPTGSADGGARPATDARQKAIDDARERGDVRESVALKIADAEERTSG